VVQACRNTGKAAAVIASSVDALVALVEEGFRLICAGMDVDHVDAAYKQMKDVFTRITGKKEFTND
jgi:2-keto-3-deoxy-L-rhamnonate aldolase RhmA